jgi:hypothetical protein
LWLKKGCFVNDDDDDGGGGGGDVDDKYLANYTRDT